MLRYKYLLAVSTRARTAEYIRAKEEYFYNRNCLFMKNLNPPQNDTAYSTSFHCRLHEDFTVVDCSNKIVENWNFSNEKRLSLHPINKYLWTLAIVP